MSKKKLETSLNKQFGLIQRLHKIGSQEAGLINLSLKLTNEFRHSVESTQKTKKAKPSKEWLEARELGKQKRKALSDCIKTFIEYAKINGSVGADRYYVNFTKMQNLALLNENLILAKVGSVRDSADLFQLNALSMSDMIISVCIKDGIEKHLPYKDIFQEAKKRVDGFAKSIGIK